MAIARIDPTCTEARRGLTLLLLRADAVTERLRAAQALATSRPDPAMAEPFDVVPALLAATSADEVRTAAEAVTALGAVAPGRPEVIARLRECAESDDRGIAARARAALRAARQR